ncbi:antiterminator Q family protein [Ursidibacter arcticus]
MLFNINNVLIVWGKMGRDKGCKGYPTMENFMRESPSETNRVMRLDDATFLTIDRLFIQLYELNQLQYEILRDKYIKQLENREICRQLHISKSQFDLSLACAKSFITGGIKAKELQIWL